MQQDASILPHGAEGSKNPGRAAEDKIIDPAESRAGFPEQQKKEKNQEAHGLHASLPAGQLFEIKALRFRQLILLRHV